jgi:hypothetical protein
VVGSELEFERTADAENGRRRRGCECGNVPQTLSATSLSLRRGAGRTAAIARGFRNARIEPS